MAGEGVEREEDLVVTMIGGAEDEGEEEACELNAGVDDLGDGTQLIPSKKKKTAHKRM